MSLLMASVRFFFISTLGTGACFALLSSLDASPASANERPNIVLIMADDIGMECLGCYGNDRQQTPHLDKLAASGIRFQHAHSQPICTPSRVQIMTGIYNNRNYIRFGLLDPAATTFGNALRDGGYKTCIAGKWQLEGGFAGPGHFGFDKYCLWQLTRRPSRYPNPGLEIDGKERDFKNGEFGPDVVSDYICEFMESHKDGPFLVYYPMIAPHWPFVPTPDHPDWDPTMWRDKTSEPGGYRDDKYWNAMVQHTDKMVGKVVDKIDALGIRENTLIIWTGDNGTFTSITSQLAGKPYRGGKGSTKDNGTHVGFMASWPGTIAAEQTADDLVDFSDLFPTLLDVAQVDYPQRQDLDGVSLAPLFYGQSREKDAIYCWYHRDGLRELASQHARDQRYKLYASGKFFDTHNDLLEQHDLSGQLDESTRGVHAKLKAVLDKQVAITRAADGAQQSKRADFSNKKSAKKKKANNSK